MDNTIHIRTRPKKLGSQIVKEYLFMKMNRHVGLCGRFWAQWSSKNGRNDQRAMEGPVWWDLANTQKKGIFYPSTFAVVGIRSWVTVVHRGISDLANTVIWGNKVYTNSALWVTHRWAILAFINIFKWKKKKFTLNLQIHIPPWIECHKSYLSNQKSLNFTNTYLLIGKN